MFTTTTTTTTIMSFSDANIAVGIGLHLESLIFRQSISSSAKLSAVTVSFHVKLDNIEPLQLSDGYELWSQKMSVISEAMWVYEMVVSCIDPSPSISLEEFFTFNIVQ
jgi:hypothetical protein